MAAATAVRASEAAYRRARKAARGVAGMMAGG